jgi:hypothetical protein
MTERPATSVVTGKVRLSFAHVWKPTAFEEGDDPKYSTVILIPKSDKATVKNIEAAIAAAEEIAKSKNGGKIPAKFKRPLRDGDIEKPEDEAYADHYFLTASSKNKPGIVKKIKGVTHAITDEDEVYSGCYVYADLNFYYFDVKSKGIACGLNNLMKAADGEAFAGRGSAEAAFADIEVDTEGAEDGPDLSFLN